MNPEEQARQFRAAYEVNNHPDKRPLQFSLIAEEFDEFADAHVHLLERPSQETAAHCLKELTDLVYTEFQYAANEGWPLMQALLRVHVSNMSKLGADGRPVRREDGKILKSEFYKPPFLDDLVSPSAFTKN